MFRRKKYILIKRKLKYQNCQLRRQSVQNKEFKFTFDDTTCVRYCFQSNVRLFKIKQFYLV